MNMQYVLYLLQKVLFRIVVLTTGGSNMTDYQKKGFLTEDYRLFHLRSDRGTRPEFHYHEFCKVLLLVSGSGGYTVDG
jgi:hypothetical protein